WFFFFQAEDGIRDFHVTGVQTCALPILMGSSFNKITVSFWFKWEGTTFANLDSWFHLNPSSTSSHYVHFTINNNAGSFVPVVAEIGRASCRERVWLWLGRAGGA